MVNNNPQNPSLNLADILRNLAALAPQNQDQSRSQTPHSQYALPPSGPTNYSHQPSSNVQYGAPQQQQPWQPPPQLWQLPAQTGWQPLQQQAWQPPQQTMSQSPYGDTSTPSPQQQYQQPPAADPRLQQHHHQQPAMHHQQPQMRQPMPDPRQIQMQQMSDAHHLQRMKEKETQSRGIDPASIIDWPSGLKCVMKTVAMNEKIICEIRKLIQIQNTHETQWYAGRRALIMASADRSAERRRNQKKVDNMLKALGTAPSSTSSASTLPTVEQEAEALKTELEVFDAKVYRAQHEMVKEMTGKLRALGVPFFGTRSGLVVLRSQPGSRGDSAAEGDGKGKDAKDEKGEQKKEFEKARDQGRIHEMELVELQRRMLAILQDLCEEK